MAVVCELSLAVGAASGPDQRSVGPVTFGRLAARPQGRPVNGAGARALALRPGVLQEQVEGAALRVDEDVPEVAAVGDADRRRASVCGRRSRCVVAAAATAGDG